MANSKFSCRYAWNPEMVALAQHRIWKPSPDDPLDIEESIEAYLRELYASYHLISILADPWQLFDMITRLQKARFPIEPYPQTLPNLTRSGQALFDLLNGSNLCLYRSTDIRQQALQTVAVESARGWRIAKEKSSQKIDSIVALSMACVAALESQAHGRWLPVGT